MVKGFYIQLCIGLFLLPFSLVRAQVNVDAFINQNSGIANQLLVGTIAITHEKQVEVDLHSFSLEGKPLTVKELQKVPMEGQKTLVSIYTFSLASKQKGLYVLPPISVNIGGQTYTSLSSTYQVNGSTQAPDATPATAISTGATPSTAVTPTIPQPSTSPLIFRLEAFFDGPQPFYPGQRAKLTYRISYNRSIDLTHSVLPLIHTKEFKNIGDKKIKDDQIGELTVQVITQEIEAEKPGTFTYGPSLIEGHAYEEDLFSQKKYAQDLLRAEADGLEVIVSQFPENIKPTSFTGAIGKLAIELQMKTPAKIKLGEKIELELAIAGATNLAELTLPNLTCQPGFSGFFELNDLPPVANIKEQTKTFVIELRPISTFVKAVPSIEISSFDPHTENYLIWHSDPIPLTISNVETRAQENVISSSLLEIKNISSTLIEEWNPPVAPLKDEITPHVILSENHYAWMCTLTVLRLIPLGGILLLLQWRWQQMREKRPSPVLCPESEKILKKALAAEGLEAITLLHTALLRKLTEQEYLEKQKERPKGALSVELRDEVKEILTDLESIKYGSQPIVNLDEIKKKAYNLLINFNLK